MYIYLECMREEILYSDGHRGYRFKRVKSRTWIEIRIQRKE